MSALSVVPQGSVLGPLLFPLFMNDLSNVVILQYHMYADNIQFYSGFHIDELNHEIAIINILATISDWAETNLFLLDVRKSQAIFIYNRILDTSAFDPIMLYGSCISYTDKVKNSGIFLNSKSFSWNYRVSRVWEIAYGTLRRLWKFAFFHPWVYPA